MLYTPEGKPRLAIFSIAHLDDAQRMFFVTMLLNEMLAWIRTQPGTSSLRAILYMDEVFGYFPPVGEPPSKRPMLTLLKQARAYGLGCVLATQNPVDLDYKGLSNAGTWFLGRLQTERDKARVIEGLEGASAQAGSTFDRGEMEATLAALGSRVFLMNNVHEDEPVVFHTRWAMSYLRGPLTRDQIKSLMDPLRPQFESAAKAGEQGSERARRPGRRATGRSCRRESMKCSCRSSNACRTATHWNIAPARGQRQGALQCASENVDLWRECHLLQPMHELPPDDIWDASEELAERLTTESAPDAAASFAALPSELAREKSYSIFGRQLEEHLYRVAALELWRASRSIARRSRVNRRTISESGSNQSPREAERAADETREAIR